MICVSSKRILHSKCKNKDCSDLISISRRYIRLRPEWYATCCVHLAVSSQGGLFVFYSHGAVALTDVQPNTLVCRDGEGLRAPFAPNCLHLDGLLPRSRGLRCLNTYGRPCVGLCVRRVCTLLFRFPLNIYTYQFWCSCGGVIGRPSHCPLPLP